MKYVELNVVFQIYKVLRYLCQSNTSLQNKITLDLGELAANAGLELLRSGQKWVYIETISCCSIGSIRDDPFWTYRKNSLELIEISSINKVSLGFLL